MKKAFILFLVLLNGCATLTRGPIKRVSINTNPSGATVIEENKTESTTPCLIHFSGFENQKLSIRKEGYEPADILITKRVLGRVWWNLLFFPGFVIDFATGSAWRLEPEKVDINLVKK